MNIAKRKHKLIQRLKDKQRRDAFVSAQIDIGIPFQIRALREQRNETQAALSARTGMAQAWISRLENINYRGFSLKTLKKVASMFDVGLVIRFVPISQLVEWELNLSNDSLLVSSFGDEPYFKESTAETQATGEQDRTKRKKGDLIDLFAGKSHSSVADAASRDRRSQPSDGAHFYFYPQEEDKRASALH